MKKTLLIIAVTILVFSVVLSCVGCKNNKKDINYDTSNLKDIDSGEDISDWMLYDENTSQEELIALAVRAYENACRLDQNCDFRRYDVICAVTTVGTMMQYVTQIKNGEEFYRGEVQVPDAETEKYLKALIKDQIYFQGEYATLDANKKVVINTDKGVSRSEDGSISADLGSGSVSYDELPYFNKSQEPLYTQTDFVINANTIKNVSISRSEDNDYYILEFDIDVNNSEAIAKPLANLNKNLENGRYLSVAEHIEIWNSGYFRYFHSDDNWKGKKGVTIEGVIDYNTYFIYDEDKCDIDDCFGISKLKEELAK